MHFPPRPFRQDLTDKPHTVEARIGLDDRVHDVDRRALDVAAQFDPLGIPRLRAHPGNLTVSEIVMFDARLQAWATHKVNDSVRRALLMGASMEPPWIRRD
jgi:hypothetical protein